jgi:hypothetical protein
MENGELNEWCGSTKTQRDVCDGVHPETKLPCVLGDHKGYHRTATGVEWLDED